jgi:hypothetical protein
MRRIGVCLLLAASLTSCLGTAVTAERPQPTPGPGTCPSPGAGATFFRDPAGRCLPPRSIREVRCDPSLPPAVVRWAGSGHERRYLGGAFSVPVHAVPDGARLAGRSSTGQEIYVRPGAPSWLWSREGSDITRWLALPASAPWARRVTDPTSVAGTSTGSGTSSSTPTVAPAPGSDAWFIGDSITDGASPFIVDALPGWTVHVDAVIGRPSVGGLTPAVTAAASVPPPAVAVVELGTNDQSSSEFRTNASQILDTLKDVPLVLWQTVRGPLTPIPSINAAIHDLIPTHPNTALADWHGFVTKDMLTSDGVHPLTEHEGAMAELVAPLLETWRAAVEGDGATGCLR